MTRKVSSRKPSPAKNKRKQSNRAAKTRKSDVPAGFSTREEFAAAAAGVAAAVVAEREYPHLKPIERLGGVTEHDVRVTARSALDALGIPRTNENHASVETILAHAINLACADLEVFIKALGDEGGYVTCSLEGLRERLYFAVNSADILSTLSDRRGAA